MRHKNNHVYTYAFCINLMTWPQTAAAALHAGAPRHPYNKRRPTTAKVGRFFVQHTSALCDCLQQKKLGGRF